MNTEKLYDNSAYIKEFDALVISCEKLEKDKWNVVLNKTAFFPEAGGQDSDTGTLNGIFVEHVSISDEIVFHTVCAKVKPFEEGSNVVGSINWDGRFSNMQQHSGEHLLSGFVYKQFGLENVGFHLSSKTVTCDYNGYLNEDQMEKLEKDVNMAITANFETKTYYPSSEQLEKINYRSKKKLNSAVRLVEFPGVDVCACCAPHVARTGEIGIFKIESVKKHKGGIRVWILCGFRALEDYKKKQKILENIGNKLSSNIDKLPEYTDKIITENKKLQEEIQSINLGILMKEANNIPSEQNSIALFSKNIDMQTAIRILKQQVEIRSGICAVFIGDNQTSYRFAISSNKYDLQNIKKEIEEKFNARGGGSNSMLQGMVKANSEQLKQYIMEK